MNAMTRTEAIANQIWKQITLSNKMACGMRRGVRLYGEENGKAFLEIPVRITYRAKHFLRITLEPTDFYSIELLKISRGEVTVEKSLEELPVENLNSVIYKLCNPN